MKTIIFSLIMMPFLTLGQQKTSSYATLSYSNIWFQDNLLNSPNYTIGLGFEFSPIHHDVERDIIGCKIQYITIAKGQVFSNDISGATLNLVYGHKLWRTNPHWKLALMLQPQFNAVKGSYTTIIDTLSIPPGGPTHYHNYILRSFQLNAGLRLEYFTSSKFRLSINPSTNLLGKIFKQTDFAYSNALKSMPFSLEFGFAYSLVRNRQNE